MMDFVWNPGNFRWLEMILLVVTWWTGFNCWRFAAETKPVDAAGKGKELISLAWRMFYNGEAGNEKVQESLKVAWDVYGLLPEGYEKYYGWAQIELLRAEMAEMAGDKKGATQNFSQTDIYFKKAYDYDNKSRYYLRK